MSLAAMLCGTAVLICLPSCLLARHKSPIRWRYFLIGPAAVMLCCLAYVALVDRRLFPMIPFAVTAASLILIRWACDTSNRAPVEPPSP